MKEKNKESDQILKEILIRVCPYNFNEAVGKSNEQAPLKKEIVVHVVDNVRNIAKQAGYDLCRHNNNAFMYIGTHWVQLEEAALSSFLGQCAEKMGVNTTESRYYEFKDSLVKQFKSVATRISVVGKKGEIKINLLNGTLVFTRNGCEMMDFNPEDFMTYQLPFNYDVNAKASVFERFLDRVLPDKTLQMILAEYIGYVFTSNSDMKLEKGLILVGEGANGKSTFYDIINGLLGRDNVSTYSMENLTDSKGYHRALIGDKLLNYASEISPKMDTTIFKQLISGEAVEARLPYKDPFIMENYARMAFNTNELPLDVEHKKAFWRRFLIVEFLAIISEEEQDKDLAKKIVNSELPGVLNWVLDGLDRLLNQGGFTRSKVIDDVVERFKKDSDTVYTFLEDNNYEPAVNNEIPLKDMFSNYKYYCSENLYRPVGNKNFRKRLDNHGYQTWKSKVGIMVGAIVTHEINDDTVVRYSLN